MFFILITTTKRTILTMYLSISAKEKILSQVQHHSACSCFSEWTNGQYLWAWAGSRLLWSMSTLVEYLRVCHITNCLS